MQLVFLIKLFQYYFKAIFWLLAATAGNGLKQQQQQQQQQQQNSNSYNSAMPSQANKNGN